MKAFALLLTYALLALIPSTFNTVEGGRTPSSSPSVKVEGKKTSQEIMDDLKIEPRKGEAVKLRADQLKRKNKAVAEAMKDMESRGMRPDFESGVSILAISKSGQFQKASAQETTIVDGEYELTFISYDDGNDATWEGIIYFKRPEGEVVYNAQLDISTNTPYVLRQTRYMGIEDSDSTRLRTVGQNTHPVQLRTVSYNPARIVGAAAAQSGGTALQEWAECAATGCISGGAACRLAGPKWAECAAIACLAVMLGCALDALW